MKLFLFCKWSFVLCFVLIAAVLAVPLFFAFGLLSIRTVSKFVEDMAARLQYRITTDFEVVRLRRRGLRVPLLGWLVLFGLVWAVVFHWSTLAGV